jgi:hydroxypyruvate isomerase
MGHADGARSSLSRRSWLQTTVGTAGALAFAPVARSAEEASSPLRGNIHHSIVQWCFADYWNLDQLCQLARKLGCQSIELVQPEDWPTLQKYGLKCAISPSHLFVQGMNNPKYQPMCLELLRKRIDQCADAGVPNVITFTGFAEESGPPAGGQNPDLASLPAGRAKIDPDQGLKNCVQGFKQIVGYAEQKRVNLVLEILNTRVTDHPMKGHPGYQGDHVDYCLEIIRQVGSPRFGILFDVYHVQIMDGDLVRRVRQCKDAIKHVHTAGNPGRCELDDKQEVNYRSVMQALVEIGYQGFVGHEFIPTRDPLAGLKQAIQVCDV